MRRDEACFCCGKPIVDRKEHLIPESYEIRNRTWDMRIGYVYVRKPFCQVCACMIDSYVNALRYTKQHKETTTEGKC